MTLYIQYNGGNPYKGFFILHVLAVYLHLVTCMCLVVHVGLFFDRFVHILKKQVAKNQQHVSRC